MYLREGSGESSLGKRWMKRAKKMLPRSIQVIKMFRETVTHDEGSQWRRQNERTREGQMSVGVCIRLVFSLSLSLVRPRIDDREKAGHWIRRKSLTKRQEAAKYYQTTESSAQSSLSEACSWAQCITAIIDAAWTGERWMHSRVTREKLTQEFYWVETQRENKWK